MPTWTLAELSSQATRRTHRADVTASDASLWVNQAYKDLITEFPEAQLESNHWFSVVSGTSLLDVPDDFMYPISLSYDTEFQSSGLTLRMTNANAADAQGYYPVGPPVEYFFFADKIQIRPSANSSEDSNSPTSGRSYRLRYYGYPTDMSLGTEVPSVATEHRIAILFKAEAYIHSLVGNTEESAAADLRFLNYISSKKDAHAKRQMQTGRWAISLPDRARRRTGIYSDPHDRFLRGP